jgi:hypothetical protein
MRSDAAGRRLLSRVLTVTIPACAACRLCAALTPTDTSTPAETSVPTHTLVSVGAPEPTRTRAPTQMPTPNPTLDAVAGFAASTNPPVPVPPRQVVDCLLAY